MKRSYLLAGALVVLAVTLWLPPAQAVLRDWLIVPLLEVFWFANLVFESIPQGFVWGFLVVLGVLVAWNGGVGRAYVATAPRPWTTQTGLLAPWARLIVQSTSDDYARWRLAQRLAQLAQGVVGASSSTELRRYLASDPAEVPVEVRAYLLAGLTNYMPQRRTLFGLTLTNASERPNDPLALDPERVVAFLEARSERAEGLEE